MAAVSEITIDDKGDATAIVEGGVRIRFRPPLSHRRLRDGLTVLEDADRRHPDRRAAIEDGNINAIFDEGILSWGQAAVDNGFRYLPIEGKVKDRMVAMGFRPTVMSKARFPGIPEEVETLDFSGWPMVVHADMADDVAYALCEAIETRKEAIPTDNYKPLDMTQLCTDDEETACDVPFHPGALQFYRERGYVK